MNDRSISFLVRLRPTGPWRIGPAGGSRDRSELSYSGDLLFSAVTNAVRYLGRLDEWLAATAANPSGSSVVFSSCFPFTEACDLVTPPRTVWPPPPSVRLRGKGARFIPVSLVQTLLSGQPLAEEAWSLDGPGECLVPAGKSGPFRLSVRKAAAVDRWTGVSGPHSAGCLEFSSGSGLWCLVSAPEEWVAPVQTALRWLADSGFGGERSRGWGRAAAPEFSPVSGLLASTVESSDYWLLSPYSPAPDDQVDWSRGNYASVTRGGWIEHSASPKKLVRLIAEGSVISAGKAPVGTAPNVAPTGYPHPVYRAGFAYSIPLPAPPL